jgi:hypothetical protein
MAGAFLLFLPFRERLSGWDLVRPVNSVAGALGVWFLSRRWMGTAAGKLIAGAVYGFGPFMLYSIRFHPLAGTIVAWIPWSFWPAVHGPRRYTRHLQFQAALTMLWMMIPFAVIVLVSILAASLRRFVIPLYGVERSWQEVMACFYPYASVSEGRLLVGCYHLALAPLLLGMGMLIKARRWMMAVPIVAAILLCCLPPVCHVSPLLWLTIPHVLGALVVGIGTEGILYAGRADRRWLWGSVLVFFLLAVTGGILGHPVLADRIGPLPGRAVLLLESTKFYALGILVMTMMAIAAHLQRRLMWLKTGVLCGAIAVDLYVCARFILGYTL